MVGQIVPLPTESAKQTAMTPTASAAVDTKKEGIFDGDAMDDNDEPLLSGPITRQAGTKSSRSERIVVCCMELFCGIIRNKVVSLVKAKSVPANMREFLSWAQRHYRIDVTASTVERKTDEPTSELVRAQVDAKILHTKVRMRVSSE